MSPDPHTRASEPAGLTSRLSELAGIGVRAVRLQYADLHGICRGKDIPISAFPHVSEDGVGFVAAIMTVDLRHNVVAGFEEGFPDLRARPDLDTLVPLPWQPDVVACLASGRISQAGDRIVRGETELEDILPGLLAASAAPYPGRS